MKILLIVRLLVQEAAWLLDEGLVPEDKCAARAIGYRQAMEFLQRCRADASHITADSLVTHHHSPFSPVLVQCALNRQICRCRL